jgi:FixJ family two-component response regulator
MSQLATICIVDDDEAIRESLQLLLFAEGRNCLAFASATEFLANRPEEIDCLLLDIRMPVMDGLELFAQLRSEHAPYPIIFITGHGDIPLAVTAIKQGAYDFLTKPFREGELARKIEEALEQYGLMRKAKSDEKRIHQRIESCTPREREVMELMSLGLPNKGIADTLDISPRTVEIHRAHVMEKMEAESLPDLIHMLARIKEATDSHS